MEDLRKWMNIRIGCIKVSGIEKVIGCPRGTIDKWLKGERAISEYWISRLNRWITWFVSDSNILSMDTDVRIVKDIKNEEKDVINNMKSRGVVKIGNVITTVKDKKGNVARVVAMDKALLVDIDTGEVKKEIVLPELKWSFSQSVNMKIVEGNIYTDGNIFEVRKLFGSIHKYTKVDTIEIARLVK